MQGKIGALWLITLGACAYGMGSPLGEWIGKARITLRVVNEDGEPVSSASVRGYFENPSTRDYVGDVFDKRTDKNGEVAVSGKVFSYMEGRVLCDEHYRTRFRFDNPHVPDSVDGTTAWPDWVATNTVVLKRIRNPVPMYMKAIEGRFPIRDEFVGYDMVDGDWVTPYGRGSVSDMEMCYSQIALSTNRFGVPLESDRTIVLRFPGDGNGMIQSFLDTTSGSTYRTSYEAPAEGYVQEWTYRWRFVKGTHPETNANPNHCHYFRIRTIRDENGEIVRAMYGKFIGSLVEKRLYYLNPDGTRNVEFDPERNLFPPVGRHPGKFAP